MYDQLKLENQLCFRLYTASRLITQAYRPYFEPLGITYPQYLVLLVLWEQDNLPVSEITSRLMLETNTVTPLLQRMEREGLIVRTRGTVDTRQRMVSLTKQRHPLLHVENLGRQPSHGRRHDSHENNTRQHN